MGLTIDENVIDMGYNGGNMAMSKELGSKIPNVIVVIMALATVFTLVVLIMLAAGKAKLGEHMQNYVGDAAGRAHNQKSKLFSSVRSGDTPWGSAVNRLGVTGDTVSVIPDQFTVEYKGKYYSDEPDSPNYVKPNDDGTYQNLNPDAPAYFPSSEDLVNYYKQLGMKPGADAGLARMARIGSEYKLGRIDLSDCPALQELQAREAISAWDWMRTEAESGSAGAAKKPVEYMVARRPDEDQMSLLARGY